MDKLSCEFFFLFPPKKPFIFFLTFQQHCHQWCAVAVLGLLHQQLAVIQDVSDGVAPFDDAVRDVAGVVLLVGAERLQDNWEMLWPAALCTKLTYVQYIRV